MSGAQAALVASERIEYARVSAARMRHLAAQIADEALAWA